MRKIVSGPLPTRDCRPVGGDSAHKVHITPRLRRAFRVYNNSPSSSVSTKNKTTATLERQTDDSKLLSWKEDFITPVFYPRNHPVNTAHSLNMLSAVGHSDVPSISSISALASLLAASPFCSRPCFGMDNIRASAAPVCVSDPHLTELV